MYSELDGVPEVCSPLLWTLVPLRIGSKLRPLPSFRVSVVSLQK